MGFQNIHAEHAAQGAKVLDQHVINWPQKINTEMLDISDIDLCILGQIFGSYARGLTFLSDRGALNTRHSEMLGFTLYATEYDETVEDRADDFALLELAWIAEINKRTTTTL